MSGRHQPMEHQPTRISASPCTAVLVIAADATSSCIDVCLRTRFLPVIRRRLHLAMAALRRQRYAAVWIDATRPEIDALECVLNVRDVDGTTPVFVLGGFSTPEGAWRMMRQAKVYRVETPTELQQKVAEVAAHELRARARLSPPAEHALCEDGADTGS